MSRRASGPTASDRVVWTLRRSVLSHRAMSDFENTRFRDHQGGAAVSAFVSRQRADHGIASSCHVAPTGAPGTMSLGGHRVFLGRESFGAARPRWFFQVQAFSTRMSSRPPS